MVYLFTTIYLHYFAFGHLIMEKQIKLLFALYHEG